MFMPLMVVEIYLNAEVYCSFLTSISSLIFLYILSMIFSKIMKFAKSYLPSISTEFLMLMVAFYTSMVLMIMSNSWMVIFLGWEGLGVTSYCLVLYWKNWNSVTGSYLTLMTNRVGDAFLLMSFFVLSMKIKSVQFFLLLLVLMMTKSCQVPFSGWLPAAMAAPTPVSALVHSSTLVTAGVYIVYLFEFPFNSLGGSKIFLVIFLLTMAMGSWSALLEVDMKKIVAFSTLSQLGLISLGFYSLISGMLILHLLTHAIFKSLMFMIMGMLIMSMYGSQNTFNFSSFHLYNYVSLFLIILSLLNMMSVMTTSGFFSKETLLLLMNLNKTLIIILMIFVLSFTFSYSYRIIKIFLLAETSLMSNHISYNKNYLITYSVFLSFSAWLWLNNFCYMKYDFLLTLFLLGLWMSLFTMFNFISLFSTLLKLNNIFMKFFTKKYLDLAILDMAFYKMFVSNMDNSLLVLSLLIFMFI
uniref:NADH:ubiquinone reductase (H(+)-translocating) n=1 Tax=Thaumamermis cosgrovei TaxID=382538 RepID=Q1HBE6_THACS|nr:NADH dehydrogenase subunit 5 [Thaumamermis cosgrovei]ABF48135.1 NADH dehydrogenase subunit 5 [Thaumamermis cosgrovei]ABF48147.1 NADH dehydrogenase subunit 5 [Thaumamermis cosgrovei]